MEAVESGIFMLGICLFGALIYGRGSPLQRLDLAAAVLSAAMGIAVAATTFLIIRSPFGRQSGAHFNPAVTLTFLCLGRIRCWDAASYVVAQFAGAIVGVAASYLLLGTNLSDPPVHFVVTTPGSHGTGDAFICAYLLAALHMGLILFATNHHRLARFSPVITAASTIFFFVFCSSISGFSVNPSRSFSSAVFAGVWQGLWIYVVAPCAGMLCSALFYVLSFGTRRVYCAKVFHDLQSPCPFPCRFHQLVDDVDWRS